MPAHPFFFLIESAAGLLVQLAQPASRWLIVRALQIGGGGLFVFSPTPLMMPGQAGVVSNVEMVCQVHLGIA